MELWIPITIAAAFLQNIRSMLQKHLKARLSTTGATLSRFLFAAPLALIFVFVNERYMGGDYPGFSAEFFGFSVIGGLGQISGTVLLIYLFGVNNFAIGTTFSKTETVQAALFGLVVLGDQISAGAIIGILVSLAGIVLISGGLKVGRALLGSTALIGLASGASFGVSAVSYRAASLSLEDGDFLSRAALTLACVTVFQSVVMAAYMQLREPGQVTAVLKSWRVSAWVGLVGGLGSLGWFTAMTLQNAAYVRALGQIELVFTLLASTMFFGERSTRSEIFGMLLVTAGIVILLLGR